MEGDEDVVATWASVQDGDYDADAGTAWGEAGAGGGDSTRAAAPAAVPGATSEGQVLTEEQYEKVKALREKARAMQKQLREMESAKRQLAEEASALKAANDRLVAKDKARDAEEEARQQKALRRQLAVNSRLQTARASQAERLHADEKNRALFEAIEAGNLLAGSDAYDQWGLPRQDERHRSCQRPRRAWRGCRRRWGEMDSFRMAAGERFIEARYGPNVAVYFGCCRWVFGISQLSMLIMLPLVTLQILGVTSSTTELLPTGSSLGFPRFLYFSALAPSLSQLTVYTLLGLQLACALVCAHKYSVEKTTETREDVLGSAKYFPLSRVAFGGFDCSLREASAVEDAKAAFATELLRGLDTTLRIREEQAKALSDKEKARLLCRRRGRELLGVLLNVLLIGAAWALIAYLALQTGTYTAGSLAEQLNAVMPITNIALQGVNLVLPAATHQIVALEKRSDEKALQHEVGRLFLGKLLSILVLLYTSSHNYVGAILLGIPLNTDGLRAQGNYGPAVNGTNPPLFSCPEDELGYVLLKTLLLDFATVKLVALGTELAKALPRKCQGKAAAKSEFTTPGYIVGLMYTQAIIWLCVPYFASAALLSPLLLLLTFKFERWMLVRFRRRPLRTFSLSHTRALVTQLYSITLIVTMGHLYIFLAHLPCQKGAVGTDCDASLASKCAVGEGSCAKGDVCYFGPFDHVKERPIDAILPAPTSTTLWSAALTLLGSPFVSYGLVCVLCTQLMVSSRHIMFLEQHADELIVEGEDAREVLEKQARAKDDLIGRLQHN